MARGVRKTSSRIGARLEPFNHVDVQFYEACSQVTQVETIDAMGGRLADDYARWTAGTAMLETAERLSAEEREPNVQQYALLVSGLRSMAAGEHEPTLILDSYLLRSLAVAGWSPSFDECARCAQPGRTEPSTCTRVGWSVARAARRGGSPSPAAVTRSCLLAGIETADAADDRRETRRVVSWRRSCSGISSEGRLTPLVDRS